MIICLKHFNYICNVVHRPSLGSARMDFRSLGLRLKAQLLRKISLKLPGIVNLLLFLKFLFLNTKN